MSFYKRIDPAFTSIHINEKILIVGKILEIFDTRLKIDTLSSEIDVNLKNHKNVNLEIGQHIEVRGELVGDNFIMADHFTLSDKKFNLELYNKACKMLFAINYN